MSNDQLFEEFQSLMHAEFSIPQSKITQDARLVDDLNLDSLDLVAASLAIEDHWGIRMEDEELASVKTVGDAFRWVEARLEPQP